MYLFNFSVFTLRHLNLIILLTFVIIRILQLVVFLRQATRAFHPEHVQLLILSRHSSSSS